MTDEEDGPVLADYMRITRTSHVVVSQSFHQRIGVAGLIYEDHGHVIRDSDSEEEKNRLARHIDAYHLGGTVG